MEGRNMMLLLLPIICLFSSDIAHADGVAQALGFYNNGALVHASELANPEGNGWLKIVRGRGRRYGSSEILDLLTGVAADIHASFPAGERLQIADIAQAQGGRISGHDSHQNGLDVVLSRFHDSVHAAVLAEDCSRNRARWPSIHHSMAMDLFQEPPGAMP